MAYERKSMEPYGCAADTGDERFLEGVRIIEERYQPEVSKQFIRAEIKNENGMWRSIPLGMTES